MSFVEDNMWLITILFAFVVFCIVAMLWRNRAAKIDDVGRAGRDTFASSESLGAQEDGTKLK